MAEAERNVRPDIRQIGFHDPVANFDGIDPSSKQNRPGNSFPFVKATSNRVGNAETGADRKIVSHSVANGRVNRDKKAVASLRTDAPLVDTPVGVRRGELSDQIAVATMNMDAVEARGHSSVCGGVESPDDSIDFVCSQLASARSEMSLRVSDGATGSMPGMPD